MAAYEGNEFIVTDWGQYSSCMTCTWQLISQDAARNESKILLRHYFFCGTNRTTGSGGSDYNLDGQNTHWNGYTVYNGYTLIQTKEITVAHNPNGDFPGRNVTISASGYTAVAGLSKTGTITGVPKIIKAAKIDTFTGNSIKGNFAATYTKYSDSYRYKLRISIPNIKALDTFDNYVSGTNVKLSQDSITYIKQRYSKTVTLGGVIETWSGNTQYDSEEINITCKVNSDAKIRVNGVWKDATPYVRVNNQWKEAVPYMRVNGAWKEES